MFTTAKAESETLVEHRKITKIRISRAPPKFGSGRLCSQHCWEENAVVEKRGCQKTSSCSRLCKSVSTAFQTSGMTFTLNKRGGRMAERFVNASWTPPTTSRIAPTTSVAIVRGSDPSKRSGSQSAISTNIRTTTNSCLG